MSISILVVDGFEPWRRTVCSMLSRHAELRLVGEVADGLAAVQQASKLQPDLILLRLDLPNLNGIETTKQVCQVVPGTKILFLSIESDADVVKAALSSGGQGYVLKTDAGNDLWPAIEAVLQGKRYVSSGLLGLLALPVNC